MEGRGEAVLPSMISAFVLQVQSSHRSKLLHLSEQVTLHLKQLGSLHFEVMGIEKLTILKARQEAIEEVEAVLVVVVYLTNFGSSLFLWGGTNSLASTWDNVYPDATYLDLGLNK